MRTNFYKYCVLKYTHSPYLGESVNIALLIYFSNTGKFSFHYSKNLSRIKAIYNNVPYKVIKEYLRSFDKKLSKFEIREDIFNSNEIDNLDTFLEEYILPKDGTALSFSKSKLNEQFDFSNDFIEKTLLKNHFIEDIKSNSIYNKEPELSKVFFNHIKKDLDINSPKIKNKLFYEDYILKNETGNEFKFDYAWQNGSLNLVKPVSFDLKDAKNIADKAYKNFGQFTDLENESKEKNLRYDLILGRPISKNLFKEYDHAVGLLERLNRVKLIEESNIKEYSLKAIEAIINN